MKRAGVEGGEGRQGPCPHPRSLHFSVAGPDFSFYNKKIIFFTTESKDVLFFLNGVLFTHETPNEIILLCRGYDAAVRPGKTESWTK